LLRGDLFLLSAEDDIGKLFAQKHIDIPTELSQDIAKLIRDATEM